MYEQKVKYAQDAALSNLQALIALSVHHTLRQVEQGCMMMNQNSAESAPKECNLNNATDFMTKQGW